MHSILDLKTTFQKLGLKSNDTVLIHGDAGIAAQYRDLPSNKRISHLFEGLIEYFHNGTIVVPSFTYSFTVNEVYNVKNSPSKVGFFSESFRNLPGILRSKHPIFSFCSIGRFAEKFRNASYLDAFGHETAFDLLEKLDGKILCLGCSLDRITFTHHIEQLENVPYRYFKYFHGSIVDAGNTFSTTTRYFVRRLDISSEIDLTLFKARGLSENLILQENFGRFPLYVVSAKNFHTLATNMLKEDVYSLTKMRSNQNDF